MLQRLSVSKKLRISTQRIVLCCGCAGLSFLAIVAISLHQRRAAANIPAQRQVSAAPARNQLRLVASYGKLPLSFEANQGQTSAPVKFLARGRVPP
jgi:hypothetical protein